LLSLRLVTSDTHEIAGHDSNAGPCQSKSKSKRVNRMDNLLADRNEISAELWRAWEAKSKRHDKAVARKAKLFAAVLITLLVLVGAYFLFVAR
jgi:hypothetical protein